MKRHTLRESPPGDRDSAPRYSRCRSAAACRTQILAVLLALISEGVSAPPCSQATHFRLSLPAAPVPGFGLAIQSSDPAGASIREIDRLIDAGELKQARARLTEETEAHGNSYATLFRDARILFRERQYHQSLKVLARCMQLNQQDPELYKLVASDAILANRMDIAETALKTALRLAPGDYLVPFQLGALYYTDSRFQQAQPLLERAMKLKPDYLPARLFLGLTLEELGQEQSAMGAYLDAIELVNRSGVREEKPYLYLGRLLYRQNRFEEGLPYLRKAVEANPRSCEGLCLLSRILMFRGREAESMTALDQCLQADSQYPEAHYLLSRVYARRGQAENAAKELALFQQLKKAELSKRDSRKNLEAGP